MKIATDVKKKYTEMHKYTKNKSVEIMDKITKIKALIHKQKQENKELISK